MKRELAEKSILRHTSVNWPSLKEHRCEWMSFTWS